MNLEQKIAKLDELTAQIDESESLEKSLQIFEQSVNLADECMRTLNDCKGKLIVHKGIINQVLPDVGEGYFIKLILIGDDNSIFF